jgi:hypothetical protein
MVGDKQTLKSSSSMPFLRELFVALVAALVSGFAIGIVAAVFARNLVQGLVYGLIGTLVVAVLVLLLQSSPVRSRLPVISWRRGPPRVDITVSGGPSKDVRIFVTNTGPRAEFHATASEVAIRNDPNAIRHGIYSVAWLGSATNRVSLIPQESHALLVARWQILEFPNPAPMMRMGEAELIEWDGSQEAAWDTFRWVFDPKQALAEYDLEVKLFSTVASEPLVLKYTLRPSHWTGPLELAPRA